MKKFTLAAALAALLVAALATTSSAAPGRTVRLLSVQSSFAMAPAPDPRPGSTMLFTDTIYNRSAQFGKKAGARIGTSEGVCTIVSDSKAQCTITAHLPNGELVVTGAMLVSEQNLSHSSFAVTGGVGAYAGARGSVSSRDLDQSRTLLEIHLLG
jgi:hypothetical protein